MVLRTVFRTETAVTQPSVSVAVPDLTTADELVHCTLTKCATSLRSETDDEAETATIFRGCLLMATVVASDCDVIFPTRLMTDDDDEHVETTPFPARLMKAAAELHETAKDLLTPLNKETADAQVALTDLFALLTRAVAVAHAALTV